MARGGWEGTKMNRAANVGQLSGGELRTANLQTCVAIQINLLPYAVWFYNPWMEKRVETIEKGTPKTRSVNSHCTSLLHVACF